MISSTPADCSIRLLKLRGQSVTIDYSKYEVFATSCDFPVSCEMDNLLYGCQREGYKKGRSCQFK